MINYNRDKNTYVRKKKRDNEALNLEKFVSKAMPVMEKMVEENQTIFFMENTAAAAKRNAVELNQEIKLP
jgi:methyl coenzyme M reductase gamma subunit